MAPRSRHVAQRARAHAVPPALRPAARIAPRPLGHWACVGGRFAGPVSAKCGVRRPAIQLGVCTLPPFGVPRTRRVVHAQPTSPLGSARGGPAPPSPPARRWCLQRAAAPPPADLVRAAAVQRCCGCTRRVRLLRAPARGTASSRRRGAQAPPAMSSEGGAQVERAVDQAAPEVAVPVVDKPAKRVRERGVGLARRHDGLALHRSAPPPGHRATHAGCWCR